MIAPAIILAGLLFLDDATATAASQPADVTSKPAFRAEIRPIRIIDHRERDLSRDFPRKHDPQGARASSDESHGVRCRQGLTIQLALDGERPEEKWIVRDVRIFDATLSEGDWPKPFMRAWIDGSPIGLDEPQPEFRFERSHNGYGMFDEEIHVLELGFKRPPQQAKSIKHLRGEVDIQIANIRTIAIELDDATVGKRIEHPVLKEAGVKIRLISPASADLAWRDQLVSDQSLSAELSGELEHLVDVVPMTKSTRHDETVGNPVDIFQSFSTEPSPRKRIMSWQANQKLPEKLQLAVRVIEERQVMKVPFEFEKIELPK